MIFIFIGRRIQFAMNFKKCWSVSRNFFPTVQHQIIPENDNTLLKNSTFNINYFLIYKSYEAYSGKGRRNPEEIMLTKSKLNCCPGYGVFPNVNNSHKVIPKAHTSEAIENSVNFSDSTASHLQGSGI